MDRSDAYEPASGWERRFWQVLMTAALLRIGYILLFDPASAGEIIVYGALVGVSVGRLKGWLSKYTDSRGL